MRRVVIGPQGGPGSPQTRFLTTQADFAIFNGQPGAGKTSAMTLDMLRGVKLPLFRGAAFRRQSNQLRQSGGLWDLAERWFPHAGAQLVGSPELEARFPSGATIQYHHLQFEKHKEGHDGASYEWIGFDELPHFTESMFWYLAGSRNRGVSGFKPCVRASTMATPDSWVHKLVRPWLDAGGSWPNWSMSGVVRWFVRNPFDDQLVWFEEKGDADGYVKMLRADARDENDPIHKTRPKSLTVVHSRTADNKIMLASAEDYESGLALMTKYERERLAGNWNARPPSSGMFDRRHFRVFDSRPEEHEIVFSVRGWDRASKIVSEANADPDWTRGVRLDVLRSGVVCISDVVSLRDRPGQVNTLMKQTAELDGPYVTQAMWINPGDSGVYEEEDLRDILSRVPGCGPLEFRRQSANKEAYARPVASFFDPEMNSGANRGAIVRAPWNGECFSEAELFPLKKHPVTGDDLHDDFVDALSRAFIEVSERKHGKVATALGWVNARV